jgi:hypothetical protein
MQSSNLAVSMEHSAPEMQFEPKRPVLQVFTNDGPLQVRKIRARLTMDTRSIVIRDQGFRPFRVF